VQQVYTFVQTTLMHDGISRIPGHEQTCTSGRNVAACVANSRPLPPGITMSVRSKSIRRRAGETAHLTWDMVLDPTGDVGSVIELRDIAAKNGSGRLIPLHPDLRQALTAYRDLSTGIGPIIRSERGGPMTPLSIVVWFNRAFRNVGLHGCSSHSGRRTFITRAARLVHKAGGSLRDVQLLAGHRSIQTTQRYIEGDTDAQRKLVAMI
jgi:integrase